MKTLKFLLACFLVSFMVAGVATVVYADAPDTQGYVVKAGQEQGSGIPAEPGDPVIWVYASTVPEENRDHIQWAADNVASGGTVVLKAGAFLMADAAADPSSPSGYTIQYDYAAFPLPPWYFSANHGNDQTVFLTRSVNVTGEKDSGGNHVSKIVGGYWPFNIGMKPRQYSFNFANDVLFNSNSNAVDTTTQALNVTVKDIEFIDPLGAAVLVVAATGVHIEGNRFTDMRGLDVAGIIGAPHAPMAYAVIVTSAGSANFNEVTKPELTTGDITIINNYFDGRDRSVDQSSDPWAFTITLPIPPYSVFYRGMTAAVRTMGISANLTIAHNTVKDSGSFGFTSEDNLPLNGSGGSTVMADNTIDLGERSSITGPDPENPLLPREAIWGMEGNWVTDEERAVYEQAGVSVGHTHLEIKNNAIPVRAPVADTEIILINLSGITLYKNRIDFSGENEMRTGVLLLNTSNGILSQNVMTGASNNGVILVGGSNNNVVRGNYFRGLRTSEAQIFLLEGTSGNVVQRNSFGPLVLTYDPDTNELLTKGAVVVQGNNNIIGADPDAPYFYYYRYVLRNDYRRCNKFGGAPGLPGGPACVLLTDTSEDNTVVEFGLWPIYTCNQIDDRGDNWIYYYWR